MLFKVTPEFRKSQGQVIANPVTQTLVTWTYQVTSQPWKHLRNTRGNIIRGKTGYHICK